MYGNAKNLSASSGGKDFFSGFTIRLAHFVYLCSNTQLKCGVYNRNSIKSRVHLYFLKISINDIYTYQYQLQERLQH